MSKMVQSGVGIWTRNLLDMNLISKSLDQSSHPSMCYSLTLPTNSIHNHFDLHIHN